MLTYILLAIAAPVVLLLLFVAARPPHFLVKRSEMITAPPTAVFAHVNDFQKWEAWSPWAKMDPACKNSFTGAQGQAGAVFAWVGNRNVGEGRMTLTESRPTELIRIKLEFFKPFKGTNTAEFTFNPDGDKTRVTWSMAGKMNFTAKLFHLFINCDEMIGKQFEKGLASMKSVVETSTESKSLPASR